MSLEEKNLRKSIELPIFQIEIWDETEKRRLKNRKVRKQVLKSRRNIYFVVANAGHEFSVRVRIEASAWEDYNQGYDWIHMELLIDGETWGSYGLPKPKPYEIQRGLAREHCFRYARDTRRPFIFAERHDYNAADDTPYTSVDNDCKVGEIKVCFRSGRSRPRERLRRNEYGRSRKYSRDYSDQLAKKIRMDAETKEKHSACRMTLGKSNGDVYRGGRRPYDIIHEGDPSNYICACTVNYDFAHNLRLKTWLDPIWHKMDRKFFPDEDWDKKMSEVKENMIVDVCDLTTGDPKWEKTTEAKREAKHGRSETSSSISTFARPSRPSRSVHIDLTDEPSYSVPRSGTSPLKKAGVWEIIKE